MLQERLFLNSQLLHFTLGAFLFTATAFAVPTPTLTPRPTPACTDAACDDGNVCTQDGCSSPSGPCYHRARTGAYVVGCSDQGSGTDCDSYSCDSSGQCVLDRAPEGGGCYIIESSSLGASSCAGDRICQTPGRCSHGTCVANSSSATRCTTQCGSGSPAPDGGDATCCRASDCSSFTGCGSSCMRPEEQTTRCCVLETGGSRIACGPGYECKPECGCVEAGGKCPPKPTPKPSKTATPRP